MDNNDRQELYFCQRQVLALHAAGLDDESFVKMTTGRMTVNEARGKLQLAPLKEKGAERLFFLEPTGIIPSLKPSTLRKAAEYWAAVEAKLHADGLQQIMDERHRAIREDLEKGVIDQEVAELLLSY